ncbi:MAG TPA: tRNA (adenosine(37)-N6)-threonylcarbamoyltransferase complex dimerization subunit type 1 TsaB [Caulobacteraceae bacterium]
MPLLAIDTCLSACQVALFDGARMIASASEPMERGHQERLAPMARDVMTQAGAGFGDLAPIAVTLGPGSFTGLRVGLAFAKGIAFATGAPLAGIGTLAALAASAGTDGVRVGVVDARRGQVYWQAFDGDAALTEPAVTPLSATLAHLAELRRPISAIGPGAALLETVAASVIEIAAPSLAALGRLAATAPTARDLTPLYLRAPDARPMAS